MITILKVTISHISERSSKAHWQYNYFGIVNKVYKAFPALDEYYFRSSQFHIIAHTSIWSITLVECQKSHWNYSPPSEKTISTFHAGSRSSEQCWCAPRFSSNIKMLLKVSNLFSSTLIRFIDTHMRVLIRLVLNWTAIQFRIK